MVPSQIKVKVAGRAFELKELEQLCTKFLKCRIDSKNLVHFLKNTIKYDTPDLREVVIFRFVKDATNAFQNEQVLDLSETDMEDIMEKKPEIAVKRVMDVLVKWSRKRMQAEVKAKGEARLSRRKIKNLRSRPNLLKRSRKISWHLYQAQ